MSKKDASHTNGITLQKYAENLYQELGFPMYTHRLPYTKPTRCIVREFLYNQSSRVTNGYKKILSYNKKGSTRCDLFVQDHDIALPYYLECKSQQGQGTVVEKIVGTIAKMAYCEPNATIVILLYGEIFDDEETLSWLTLNAEKYSLGFDLHRNKISFVKKDNLRDFIIQTHSLPHTAVV